MGGRVRAVTLFGKGKEKANLGKETCRGKDESKKAFVEVSSKEQFCFVHKMGNLIRPI